MLASVPCLLLDESFKGCGPRVADVGVVQEGERLLQVVPLLLVAAGGEHLQEQSPISMHKDSGADMTTSAILGFLHQISAAFCLDKSLAAADLMLMKGKMRAGHQVSSKVLAISLHSEHATGVSHF